MKIIAATSKTYRLMFFLKYKGIIEKDNIVKEIPAQDLGLRFSLFDPYSLYVPKLTIPGLVGCVQRIT